MRHRVWVQTADRFGRVAGAWADRGAGHWDAHFRAQFRESGRDFRQWASEDAPKAAVRELSRRRRGEQRSVAWQAPRDELRQARLAEDGQLWADRDLAQGERAQRVQLSVRALGPRESQVRPALAGPLQVRRVLQQEARQGQPASATQEHERGREGELARREDVREPAHPV